METDLEFDRGHRNRTSDQEVHPRKRATRPMSASRASFTGKAKSASEEPRLKIAFLKELKEKARESGIMTAEDFARQMEGKNISPSRTPALDTRVGATLDSLNSFGADSIHQLDLPTETLNWLERAGILTLTQLENCSRQELLKRGLSTNAANRVLTAVELYKSSLILAI